MLGKKTIVIGIRKGKFVVAKVSGKKIKKSKEYNWDIDTLDLSLAKAVDELKIKSARVLIGGDLSYVLRLKIPSDMEPAQERRYIAEQISEQIPEELADSDWDFKELHFNVDASTQKEKDIIVFAPVKGLFKTLSESAEKLGIKIVVIEPEVVAAVRHSNPLVGIALKKDVEGKDIDTLNIKPLNQAEDLDRETTPEEDESLLIDEAKRLKKEKLEDALVEKSQSDINIPREKKSNKLKIFFFVFVLGIAGVVIGSGIYLYQQDKLNSSLIETLSSKLEGSYTSRREGVDVTHQEPTPVSTEAEATVEQALTPTETPEVNIEEISIQIQNGTGVAGEADYASDIILAEGFILVENANADNFDYTDTEIRLKETLPESVFTILERALNSDYTVVKGDSLDINFEYDVVVIIGQRSS